MAVISGEDEAPRATLEQLMLKVGHGDQDAFSELYDRTSQQLFSAVSQIVSDNAAAEDVLLDLYVAVWKSAPRLDRPGGWAAPWMLARARKLSLDHPVHRRRQLDTPSLPQ